MILISVPKVL